MSIQDSVGVYDQAEFAETPEARCSIVLILDVSGSMRGLKIDTVNQALVKFRDITQGRLGYCLRADVAVIEFDHEARVVSGISSTAQTSRLRFSPSGAERIIPMPVNLALDITKPASRATATAASLITAAWAYFLTDGYPEHDDDAALAQARGPPGPRWKEPAASPSSVSALARRTSRPICRRWPGCRRGSRKN